MRPIAKWFLPALTALALTVGAADPAGAGQLTTMFANTTGQDGNMFDIVTGDNALTITAFDLNLSRGTWDVALYIKSGTWEGFDKTPGAWTQIGGVTSVTSSGSDQRTFFDVADFVVAANATTALYITTVVATPSTGAMRYTEGAGVGNVVASNADLSILEGAGTQYAFSFTFERRIWNGTIYYDVNAIPEPSALISGAIAGVFGLGYGWRRRKARTASRAS